MIRKAFTGAILLLALFCFATNPFADSSLGDSSVFSYVGRMMTMGRVPFRDVFDHKGPLIFVINYLGMSMGCGYFGLWLIEILFFLLGIFLIVRFCRDFFPRTNLFLVVGSFVALYFWTLAGNFGNMTESYALLFILYSLLTLLRAAIANRSFSKRELIFMGMSFMAVFQLRANMTTIAFVVATFVLAQALKRRSSQLVLEAALYVGLGMLIVFLPFWFYFQSKGAVGDWWYASIEFNLVYASKGVWRWKGYMMLPIAISMLNGVLLAVESDAVRRRALVWNQLFALLSLIVLMMNPQFRHYFLVAVPGVILPLAIVGEKCFLQNTYAIIMVGVILFTSVLRSLLQANFDIGGYVRHVKSKGGYSDILQYKEGAQFRKIQEFKPFIDEPESVLLYGASVSVYNLLGVSTTFKYFAHTVNCRGMSEVLTKAVEQRLDSGIDRYIIVEINSCPPDAIEAIKKSGYEIVKEVEGFVLLRRKTA